MSRSKYGAVPTVVDGIRFASKAESRRYQELRLLAAAGRIRGLKLQPRYKLYANLGGEADKPVAVCVYVADSEYEELHGKIWVLTTEEIKGFETAVWKLKRKFFRACYGRDIRVIKA